MMPPGYTEGDVCGRDGCAGIIEMADREGSCSCHINPPCSACMNRGNCCPACDWMERDDPLVVQDWQSMHVPTGIVQTFKRVLDPTKVDYVSSGHTASSMIKEGVYPPHMSRKFVEAEVRGTFGGRFERFENGRFKYVAYTD